MITKTVSKEQYEYFKKTAENKINVEKWENRNKDIKIENFTKAFISERAFSQILHEHDIPHKSRGFQYIGSAEQAPKDIIILMDGKESIDVKCTDISNIKNYGSICFPADRYWDYKKSRRDKIEDYIVASSRQKFDAGYYINFYGYLTKDELIKTIDKKQGETLYSKKNQERFYTLKIEKFHPLKELLSSLISKISGQTTLTNESE